METLLDLKMTTHTNIQKCYISFRNFKLSREDNNIFNFGINYDSIPNYKIIYDFEKKAAVKSIIIENKRFFKVSSKIEICDSLIVEKEEIPLIVSTASDNKNIIFYIRNNFVIDYKYIPEDLPFFNKDGELQNSDNDNILSAALNLDRNYANFILEFIKGKKKCHQSQ